MYKSQLRETSREHTVGGREIGAKLVRVCESKKDDNGWEDVHPERRIKRRKNRQGDLAVGCNAKATGCLENN